jgi:hypothetical protein
MRYLVNYIFFMLLYHFNIIMMGWWWWAYLLTGDEWLLVFVCLMLILYINEPEG